MARTPLDELEPRRVCIVKPSAIGDVVQSLPVLAGLKARWPQAEFAWVIHHRLAELLAGHPQLDLIIPFERGARGIRGLTSAGRLVRRLWGGDFDLTIDLQGLLRSGVMALATAAPRRVGFANAREGSPIAYTDRVPLDRVDQSAVTRYWLSAKALGCTGDPPPAVLGLTSELRAWARRQLAALPRPIVAIHPGAQWETKRWVPESFAVLADRAQREFGAGIVVVGGQGEKHLADAIADQLHGPTVNLAEQTSLLQLAALLEASDVTCSGDTGPMHLAAAVGSRVVAVFTCTSPILAGPYGPGHRVVVTNVACAGSYLRRCPNMICKAELSPERVWPALRQTLGEVCQQPAPSLLWRAG